MNGSGIFRTRSFTRWMAKSGLDDHALTVAVDEMQRGLVDAELGGHLFKKRISLPGRGKRGGARVIVATRSADRWIFLFGFGKNERANINHHELALLRKIAEDLLALPARPLSRAIEIGELIEVIP